MSGVLSFSQFVGGPDDMIIELVFPSNQKTLIYNFQTDITGWTFHADYQTIVVDTVQFSRATSQPNFTNSSVIGTFPKVDISGAMEPEIVNATNGTVKVHFPADMYTGPIIPDARKNVPITVFSFTWTDANTPSQTMTHRHALVQSWEPDVVAGDPTLEVDYSAIVVSA